MDSEIDGYDYERICAKLLEEKGFRRVKVTQKSRDQGVDIIARKGGKKYAVQCKYYSSHVGIKSVQQVYSGMSIYGCKAAIVITNNEFTSDAKKTAESLGVELWPNVKVASSSIPEIKRDKSSKTVKKSRKSSKTNTYNSRKSSARSRKRRASGVNKKGIAYAAAIAVLLVVLIVLLRSPALQENNVFTNLSTNITEAVSDTTSSSSYILADSDTRYYSESELSGLSKEELRLARNEIYARHGRKFDSEELQEYFGNQSWYEGTIEPSDFSDSLLNGYEKANLDTIIAVEDSK